MAIQLLPSQQIDLIRTVGVPAFGVVRINEVNLSDYDPRYVIGEDYHLRILFNIPNHSTDIRYVLVISYPHVDTGYNPETIALYYEDGADPNSELGLLKPLGGLGKVVKKLQDYRVWQTGFSSNSTNG